MSFEKGRLDPDHNKKSIEELEKEIKAEKLKTLEFQKEKEALIAQLEAKKELAFLKNMVERGLISPDIAKEILKTNEVVNTAVEEIFDKIDEIEDLGDEVLPKDLRITKEEYKNALVDEEAKEEAIKKLNNALDYLATGIIWDTTWFGLGFMRSFMSFLSDSLSWSKEMIQAQENTIDIKRSLTDKEK